MYKTIRQSIDLALGGGELCWPDSLAVQGEAAGHRWVVSVLDGGRPAALDGATAECYVVNGGVTNRLDAAIEGSAVSVVFSAGCYAQSGELRAILRVYAADGAAPAVALLRLRVQEGMTDVISDPGHVIPSLKELLSQLDACRESARQADAAASAAGTAADEADEAASAAGTAASAANTAAGAANTAAVAANTAAGDCEAAAGEARAAASECARAASTATAAAQRVDALDVDGLTRACETAAQTALDAAGTVGDAIAQADTAASGADAAARRAIEAIQGVENLDVDGLREACESAAQTALDAVSTVDDAIAQANAKADEAAAGANAAAESARAASTAVDAAIATADESARAASESARAASTAAEGADAAAATANESARAASTAAEGANAAAATANESARAASTAAEGANAAAATASTAAAAATQAVEGLDVQALYAGYAPRNGLYDGADLKAVFGTAGALHAAVNAGDFSKIRVGDFWPVTLSGAFRDYASATSLTLSSVELVLEVAGINVYLNYGDQSVAQNHLVFCSRDLLPAELKYRSGTDTWYSTSEKNPWRGSHLFQTLNNASNGLLPLMLKTDLGSYIYKGPNSAGMRILGEVKPSGAASATNFEWMDRGRLFLPTEREVWGQDVFSDHSWGGGAVVQWPLFHGSLRHIIKTRADRRTGWWCQDSAEGSPNNFTCVRTYGHPANYQSINPFSAPVCFLLI